MIRLRVDEDDLAPSVVVVSPDGTETVLDGVTGWTVTTDEAGSWVTLTMAGPAEVELPASGTGLQATLDTQATVAAVHRLSALAHSDPDRFDEYVNQRVRDETPMGLYSAVIAAMGDVAEQAAAVEAGLL